MNAHRTDTLTRSLVELELGRLADRADEITAELTLLAERHLALQDRVRWNEATELQPAASARAMCSFVTLTRAALEASAGSR